MPQSQNADKEVDSVVWQILRRNVNTESSTMSLEMRMMRDIGWSLTSATRPIRLMPLEMLLGTQTLATHIETEVVAVPVAEIEIKIDTAVDLTVAVPAETEAETRERPEIGNGVVSTIVIVDAKIKPHVYMYEM
jgi:hypothetical protein